MSLSFRLLLLACIAFIALGLPDALLGLAWPSIQLDFGVPIQASGLLLLAGTLGAALSGFFSANLGRRFGVGRLLGLGCTLTGLALLGYTLSPSFYGLIGCAVMIGLSVGITDATINAFVAKNYSDRIMQWLHASFGIGITLGPIVMTWVLVQEKNWRFGYELHAGVQLVLAALFFVTAALWVKAKTSGQMGGAHEEVHHSTTMTMAQSLQQPSVWLAMLMFFLYTGLEVAVGLWTFSLLTEARSVPTAQAGLWVSLYWAMFTVGRITMGFVANRFSNHSLMVFSFILALIASSLFAIGGQSVVLNLLALVSLGFAFAPIFPALISSTHRRVGKAHFNNTMGLQVTGASLGIALLPGSMGVLAGLYSLALIPWLMLVITVILIVVYFVSMRVIHDPSQQR